MRQGDFRGFSPIFDVTSTSTFNGVTTRAPFPNNIIPPEKINPISLKLITLFPDPINSALNNNYQRNGSRDQTDDTVDTRIDHHLKVLTQIPTKKGAPKMRSRDTRVHQSPAGLSRAASTF